MFHRQADPTSLLLSSLCDSCTVIEKKHGYTDILRRGEE